MTKSAAFANYDSLEVTFIEVLDFVLMAFKVFGPDFIVILAVGVYRFDSFGLTNLLWLGGIVIGGIRVLISDLPGAHW